MRLQKHKLSPLEQHQIFLNTFGSIDAIALGTAFALTLSFIFMVVTTVAISQDASDLKNKLDLLGNYFPGFQTVSPQSLLAIPYGAIVGFLLGFSFATARNIATHAVLNFVKLSSFTVAIEQSLDD